VRVAQEKERAEFTPEAKERIDRCAQFVQQLVQQDVPIYGVTTGIGELARIRLSPEKGEELQRRIIYSHSAGYGEPLSEPVVRGAMLLRANTLARGHSGVRLSTAQMLLDMLNNGITPVVYEKGSLGASGDLSPLSQIAEVVIGEGEAFLNGERLPGAVALSRAGLKPVTLTYKEGLGLINGSQVSLAGAVLTTYEGKNFLKNAIIASAFTIDVLKGVQAAYDPRLHRLRPFNGQNIVAHHLRRLMEDSQIISQGSSKVQDGYSLRCVPQVLGPSVDAWLYVRDQLEAEINSTSDNPIFIPEEEAYLTGGNFHSQNISMAMDFLGIALAEVANLSERHINRLLNPVLSGLPDFLVEGQGLNSGLMVAQYTAAALVSENKVLSHPAVVDSISV
ncbi:MAG: histidine ammonia-lyase, partial [bacterium]